MNLKVLKMIKVRNKSKTLAKHIKCKYKCKCKSEFDGRKCNPQQKWNNNERVKIMGLKINKTLACQQDYIWNRSACKFWV